ncbi:hypothetical protein POPTR_008G011380v4 [Populus trichocarpa]|uniref:Secreted protein n=1 Tax=Populus trichocarpa TaxID=3694 RepID=A0A3N7FC81_POPTR|nr:hypothetical protein BDE02_08G008400 [Populus trichocarpa]RQO94003.1 hypothetical protein POPTR_008G011380v4 [Populus trichocarpa]
MFCYFMLPSLGFLGCFQCSIEEGPIKNWQGPNPCSVLLSKSLYRHVVKYMCTYINIWWFHTLCCILCLCKIPAFLACLFFDPARYD